MTTSIDTPKARSGCVLFANGQSMLHPGRVERFERQNQDGTSVQVHLHKDVPVFRSGTFRDSMGYERSWEALHMGQMAAHFELLRSREIFAKVPVRAGHPGMFSGDPIHNIIGYITALRVETKSSPADGEEYSYLIADYEILDPEAQKKIDSGLWVNRSAEVGEYMTNAPETAFWPVFMGVAYVDIPAVEGLNFAKALGNYAQEHQTENFSIQMEETVTVKTNDDLKNPPAPGAPGGEALSVPMQFTIAGGVTADFAKVQGHINTLEGENASLREFQRAALQGRREDFVNGLAAGDSPKIAASAVEGLIAFASDLTAEQFTAWSKTWDGVAPIEGLGKLPETEDAEAGRDKTEAFSQDDVDRKLLSNLRMLGRVEAAEKSEAFARVKAADPTFTL